MDAKKALSALAFIFVLSSCSTTPPSETVPTLSSGSTPASVYSYSDPVWDSALGGDGTDNAKTYGFINNAPVNMPKKEASFVKAQAAALTVNALTADRYPPSNPFFIPPDVEFTPATYRCSGTPTVLAAHPSKSTVTLPDGSSQVFVKTLVVFAGKCDGTKFTLKNPGFEHIYFLPGSFFENVSDPWVPVQPWQIPSVSYPAKSPSLEKVSFCSQDQSLLLNPQAALAFSKLCAEAQSSGINLNVVDAYRTLDEQKTAFDQATDSLGSQEAALAIEDFSDGKTCLSRHCSGLGLLVEPEDQVLAWLLEPVGCVYGSKTDANVQGCKGAVLSRVGKYGFSNPNSVRPGHLEFLLPAGAGKNGVQVGDCNPQGLSSPATISAVFRCRLEEKNIHPRVVERTVAEALVVSRCSSGWNPRSKVFNGKYFEKKHKNGKVYRNIGLFSLPYDFKGAWSPKAFLNPVDQAHQAASIWLYDRSWKRFYCATGTNPVLDVGPVLPQFGSSKLPAWAYQW